MDKTPQPTLLETRPTSGGLPRAWKIENVIDGRALEVQLTAAALDNIGDETAMRARALDLMHSALFRGRMIAQERLQQGADGLDTARLLSAVQDEVLKALFAFTTMHVFPARNAEVLERFAVFATGGYGRGVLAPSSDIDLLFLHEEKDSPRAERVIEHMLYILWDIGLKVGHALRDPRDCVRLSREDVTIKTSLLDARFLAGDAELADEMQQTFRKQVIAGQDAKFIEDKLAERDERHARQGDARYVVEPNIKTGKGGLRDLQTLYWIIRHTLESEERLSEEGASIENVMGSGVLTNREHRGFIRATRFLWTVRCHLHYLTGRAEERLSFDLQPEIAARMGYQDRAGRLGVERFMKRYFLAAKDVGALTRIIAAKLEAERKKKPEGLMRFLPRASSRSLREKGFVIDAGRLSVEAADVFADDPAKLIQLFVLADKVGVDIHPDAMSAASRLANKLRREVRNDDRARGYFLAALLDTKDPARILRLMNEAGVLGRFVPEFGGIVAQTQFNMYHHFTVDEHTLKAVEVMAEIDRNDTDAHELASGLMAMIENRRALYLAMLLHDTGKGLGDQQVEGMITSKRASARLGLDETECDLIGWLVGHHLEMSETAQKRDISDPRTVTRFAALVGSLERLRLLYVLTVCDIRAVGPGVWNAWKSQLLSSLYHATAAALRGGRTDESGVRADLALRAEDQRARLLAIHGSMPLVLAEMENAYWAGFPGEELLWHAQIVNSEGSQVEARLREEGDGVALLVACDDRLGLFADLVGAIASVGASVMSAQVFTNSSGRVVDVFILQDGEGGAFAGGEARRLRKLEATVLAALTGEAAAPDLKPREDRRAAAFLVQPSVQMRNDLSAQHTVIDIGGRDRPGLLKDLANAFSSENLSIHSAHIGSYGERVFDAFYVQTKAGGKLTDEDARKSLEGRLFAALGREEPDAPSTPTRRLRQSKAADSF